MSWESGTFSKIDGDFVVRGAGDFPELPRQTGDPLGGGPPLLVRDPVIIERPGYSAVTVTTIYHEGQTVRREVRSQGTFDWVEEFFGICCFSNITGWYTNSASAELPGQWQGRTWSVVDSSSPQTADVRGRTPWILIQTAEEVAHGTLRGQRQWENAGSYGTGSSRWDTDYRIERIGATPVPDPAEPLPVWTEPGEEPRREPTPEPEPAPEQAAEPEPRREDFARSFDPDTGITTESRRGPDGAVTVTRTDRDGNVISRETRPPGQPRLPSASMSQ